MEMNFHSHANKTHFHKKGCVLDLILKVRILGTRKWLISVRVGSNIAGKIAAVESPSSTSTRTILKYHCVPLSAKLLKCQILQLFFITYRKRCSLGDRSAVVHVACNHIE